MRRLRLSGVILALALIAASCGGDDGDEPVSQPAEPASEEPAAEPEPAVGEPAAEPEPAPEESADDESTTASEPARRRAGCGAGA